MIYDLILKNAKIITPTGEVTGDLAVSKGKIVKIGNITNKAKEEKDCTGLFVLPGLIDMHVHFRDPGFPQKEDFHTGSMAAAAGGVTTVIDMPNTNPPTLTVKALEEKRAIAAKKSVVNYGFYMGVSKDNIEEIKNAKNIAGVKLYMGSTTGNMLVEDHAVIEKLFGLGKFVIVHAEDEETIRAHAAKYKDSEDPSVHSLIRDPSAALKAAKTILHIAKKCDERVHITHLSTLGEVEELRKFKGPKVSADCTPHHLYLDQSDYAKLGNFVKMNPPVRTKEDRAALWVGLKEGLIQAVATDHAPHTKAEKEQTYSKAPSGVPTIETYLALLLDSVNHGEITIQELVKFTSENPAKLLGIKNKGRIEIGADADLVIVDMEKEKTVGDGGYFTKCGWSPFEGRRLKGWPVTTIINGKEVFSKGKIDQNHRGAEVTYD